MDHWMFNCKEVSQKVSESFDRKLPLVQRMLIRAHFLMCRDCARFLQQLLLIRKMARYAPPVDNPFDNAVTLSPDARKRLNQTLKSATTES